MARAYVSLGTNVDREANVRAALGSLRTLFGALTVSPVYESRSVGFAGENFYNLVVAFDTDLEPEAVVATLKVLEDQQGRDRSAPRFSDRTLDLDLILYGDRVMDRQGLVLPRPEVSTEPFVLRPLADIAGEECHPVLGRRYADIWASRAGGDDGLWPVDMDVGDGFSADPEPHRGS